MPGWAVRRTVSAATYLGTLRRSLPLIDSPTSRETSRSTRQYDRGLSDFAVCRHSWWPCPGQHRVGTFRSIRRHRFDVKTMNRTNVRRCLHLNRTCSRKLSRRLVRSTRLFVRTHGPPGSSGTRSARRTLLPLAFPSPRRARTPRRTRTTTTTSSCGTTPGVRTARPCTARTPELGQEGRTSYVTGRSPRNGASGCRKHKNCCRDQLARLPGPRGARSYEFFLEAVRGILFHNVL